MTTKKLTLRQARWAKFLSKYNFIISYQSGKKNKKADALTRKPNKRPISKNNEKLEYCMQTLLLPEHFKHVVNLKPNKIRKNSPNDNITSGIDPTEPHKEGSTLPEEIMEAN